MVRALMLEMKDLTDAEPLRDWGWLVSPQMTPLMVSVFGDVLLGAPDGSLWLLSMLDGECEQIAANVAEYNRLKREPKWLDERLLATWQLIAERNGLDPKADECLGWKVHPLIGGQIEVENLQVFSLQLYQSLMGQLHRQLRPPAKG